MESHQKHATHGSSTNGGNKHHYVSLAIQLAIHFVIMYLVMYTMIATLEHLYLNINNF